MQFEIGKKYRTRDGRLVEFIRPMKCNLPNRSRLFIGKYESDSNEFTLEVGDDGRFTASCESPLDIISDEPANEPVEIALKRRFSNVYRSASGEESLGTLRETREECLDAAKGVSTLIGIYELPATIMVEPK